MKISNIVFAPLFVILIHYFAFKDVVFAYLCIAFLYLLWFLIKKKPVTDVVIVSTYIVILAIAYYFSSIKIVKFIPAILSLIFAVLFLDSYLNGRHMVLGFTKLFYKKELSQEQKVFLERGDLYWVFVMLINTVVHLIVVYSCDDNFWAFYASIGWYGLFFSALAIQIIYGKVRY